MLYYFLLFFQFLVNSVAVLKVCLLLVIFFSKPVIKMPLAPLANQPFMNPGDTQPLAEEVSPIAVTQLPFWISVKVVYLRAVF